MDTNIENGLKYRVQTAVYAGEESTSTVSFSLSAHEWSIFEASDSWHAFLNYVQDCRKAEQRKQTAAMELRSLAAPIVEWIRKNHGYHTDVHISADHVWVKHDGLGIPYPISEE